jgi:hypothetical protein
MSMISVLVFATDDEVRQLLADPDGIEGSWARNAQAQTSTRLGTASTGFLPAPSMPVTSHCATSC